MKLKEVFVRLNSLAACAALKGTFSYFLFYSPLFSFLIEFKIKPKSLF
jgi:hypothetical protein